MEGHNGPVQELLWKCHAGRTCHVGSASRDEDHHHHHCRYHVGLVGLILRSFVSGLASPSIWANMISYTYKKRVFAHLSVQRPDFLDDAFVYAEDASSAMFRTRPSSISPLL